MATKLTPSVCKTVSYLRVSTLNQDTEKNKADVAQHIGVPKAVRAVASACAANTLAVAIPCHRVVRTDGSLSCYRWGAERKAELLRRESET